MKKFLSLVLALVMTMSLVTISAGATEYKDLTDKDEIQYEEAVAVLNRIGIITGYEDGTFRPETELTRGAAAKIIVSLMIGPEAANALPNNASPYPDVPAGHTFAGVIGYCKTAGYISGYGDGTFKPANSLTGYAFAKMLLGALGYKSDVEGFTGTGWTMNVARLGNEANLFNRLNFDGAASVNREQACQLALNTLKATMVEYSGGFNVTAGDATVVGAQTRTYKISNQQYAANINNRKLDTPGNANANSHWTVEFGEEHFKDLRLDDDHENKNDPFGRPSNVWSSKKVTIGTYPIDADFTFTAQMAYSDKSDAVKNRATGLSGYTLVSDEAATAIPTNGDGVTHFWVNGQEFFADGTAAAPKWNLTPADEAIIGTNDEDLIRDNNDVKISNICDLTDNGTVVEVYVSEDEADFITDVVVIKSQLMEVKKIGSDYVSLEKKDPADDNENFPGFNQNPIDVKVENVQIEDNAYSVLKDLKAEDDVVIIPVLDGDDWKVAEAYKPETVSGALTGVKDYGPTNSIKNAVAVTVGGTDYNISLWNKDLHDIDGEKIKVTKKDVTLTLDKFGNTLLAEDVGSTSEWMVIGSFRSTLENGRIVTLVTGWDISGEAIELNLGPNFNKAGFREGDLVKYSSTAVSNLYDWKIDNTGVYDVKTSVDAQTGDPYKIKASNVKVDLRDYANDSTLYIDKGVKFIYVTFDADNEVENIEVMSGVRTVENKELRTTAKGEIPNRPNMNAPAGLGNEYYTDSDLAVAIDNYNAAQAAVTDKGAIKAVVIKQESNEADSASMLYIRDMPGGAHYDANGKMVYVYTVAMNTKDGVVEDATIYSHDRLYRGDFASYVKTEHAEHDEFYTLRERNNFVRRTTSTFQAQINEIVNVNASLVKLGSYKKVSSDTTLTGSDLPHINGDQRANLGVGDETDVVTLKYAEFVDLTGKDVDSFDDLEKVMKTDTNGVEQKYRQQSPIVQLVVNDNPDTDAFRRVSMIVITGWIANPDITTPAQKTLLSANIKGITFSDPINASNTITTLTEKAAADTTKAITFTHNGDKIEVKLNGAVIANGSTAGLNNGDVITVTVYARNHTDAAPNTNVYTFTISGLIATQYNNTTAQDHSSATGYVDNDWNDNARANVTLSGKDFSFPFLNTGVESETKAQIEEAVAFWNETSATAETTLGTVTNAGGGLWIIANGLVNREFQEPTGSSAKVLVKTVDGSTEGEKIVAGDTKVETGSIVTNTANCKTGITLAGSTTMAVVGDVDVVPGATYTKDAYVVLSDLPAVTGDDIVTAEYDIATADKSAITATNYVKIGATVKVVFTVKAEIDGSGATNGASITIVGRNADGKPTWDGEAAAFDATNSTNLKAQFTAGDATSKAPAGKTVTFTYTVDKATDAAAATGFKLTSITGANPA